jgi:hypothetical protein
MGQPRSINLVPLKRFAALAMNDAVVIAVRTVPEVLEVAEKNFTTFLAIVHPRRVMLLAKRVAVSTAIRQQDETTQARRLRHKEVLLLELRLLFSKLELELRLTAQQVFQDSGLCCLAHETNAKLLHQNLALRACRSAFLAPYALPHFGT